MRDEAKGAVWRWNWQFLKPCSWTPLDTIDHKAPEPEPCGGPTGIIILGGRIPAGNAFSLEENILNF